MKKICEIHLSENERTIIGKISNAVNAVIPGSSVIFYGSRARGNPQEHSDWDILILTDTVTPEIKDSIYDALYDIELEYNIIIGPLILPRDEWDSKRFKNHPIHERIDEEGVLV